MLRMALLAGLISGLAGCGRQMTFGELDKELGAERICADLLKGDYAAASEPIRRKTPGRKLTFSSVITWLARQARTPYVEIPASRLFRELPADQGALKTCRVKDGFTLTGEQMLKQIYLEYPRSRLSVMLRYSGPSSPRLDFIEISGVEKTFAGQEAPDAFEKRMSEFNRTLDSAGAKP